MTIKSIYYYSLSGKTQAILESVNTDNFNMVNLRNIKVEQFQFTGDIIIIACPTYGRGAPPSFFKKLIKQLNQIKDKKIGLLGSGNTIYGEDYCGALDVLEEILSKKNAILFKLPFEGYPKQSEIMKFESILNDIRLGEMHEKN